MMMINSANYDFIYPIVEDVLGDFDIDSKYKIDEITRTVVGDDELNREMLNLIEDFIKDLITEH